MHDDAHTTAHSAQARVTPCVSFCESEWPHAKTDELIDTLSRTCEKAGFPYCERIYVGSYFCENYFLSLDDGFHAEIREMCARHTMNATLVVPIMGQAFLHRGEHRIANILERFDDLYDEVIVNDIACFMDLSKRSSKLIGLGRLFSKAQRDARYQELFWRESQPSLSPEAIACLEASPKERALIDVDPVSSCVDVGEIIESASQALHRATTSDETHDSSLEPMERPVEIAIHLPYCYATTGRNCSAASIDMPDHEKFRLGRSCKRQCLHIAQGSRVENGVRYTKHGRTYYFENPECQIAGTDRWRIVYAASNMSMR